MQKVSKIVIGRLRAEALALDHPDADLLTAFAEKSLSEKERGNVLEHLGRCADCREVLALSLPELDHDRAVVEGSAMGGWFTWPTVRWGLVTAGLLIAGFGVLQYQRYSRMPSFAVARSSSAPGIATEARNEPQPAPAVPAAAPARGKSVIPIKPDAQIDLPGPLPAPADGKSANMVSVPPDQMAKARAETTARPGLSALAHGPRMNQINQTNQANQASQQIEVSAPVPENVPAANTASAAVIAATPAPPKSAPMSGRDVTDLQPLQNQRLDQQTHDGGSAESKVEKMKPLDGIAVSSTPRVIRSAPRASADGALALMGAPSWTISSTGALQRSFDQGHTWQDVNVNNSAVGAGDGARLSYSADLKKQSLPALPDEKDIADKAKAMPLIVFRAVSANGADVWAGGSSGLLYHSTDSGAHWVRIVPFTNDSFLTGDVVSLQFADPQHGKVTTSTSETWLTGDAGKSWQKQ